MSTEYTDTATRCDRCERVTLGVRTCYWQIDTGLGEAVAISWKLCRRCRTDATQLLTDAIREPVAW